MYIYIVIIEKLADEEQVSTPEYQFGIFTMPEPEHKYDAFWDVAVGLLPFAMIVAFLYPYFYVTGFIVNEKASKIKEGLKMMGSSTIVYWSSIYIYFGIKFFIVAFLCTIMSRIGNLFSYSDFGIIFVWYLLFLWTLLTSSVLTSTFFDNPKTASMIAIVILFSLYILYPVFETMNKESSANAFCLIGPACFSFSVEHLAHFEVENIGLKHDTITQSYKNLKFQMVLVMLFIDSLLYTILAMYFDQVIPSKFGQKLPWYFIFQKNYWFPNTINNGNVNERSHDIEMEQIVHEKYEKPKQKREVTIKLRNVIKQFSMGLGKEPFTAVNGVSLDMYDNEIFGLLGHNGAGKTTLINCLSGMLPITSGYANINGLDVYTDIGSIRQSLGICPQHDVLWDFLTVYEHLILFARMKGVSKSKLFAEVDDMIEKIGMNEKKQYYPTQLSGGQKRKLSLGIALIGGSKIVFLDEPSSGMDPNSYVDYISTYIVMI